MAEKKTTATAETILAETVYVPRQTFAAKYGKPLIIAAAAVFVLVAGWLGYKNFIQKPNEDKAAEMIFPAEKLFSTMASAGFNKDSVNILLKGGMLGTTKVTGLLNVIKEYGSTPAGNMAHYMAGAAYLQTGDYKNAIDHLKDFDDNGASQTDIKRYLMLGHAYAEQNNKDEAFKAYKKAGNINSKDEALTPDALIIAAAYAGEIGKKDESIELYKKVRDEYPAYQAVRAGDVDKELAKAGVFE